MNTSFMEDLIARRDKVLAQMEALNQLLVEKGTERVMLDNKITAIIEKEQKEHLENLANEQNI